MALNFITDPAPEYSYEEEMAFNTQVVEYANGVEQRQNKRDQPKKVFTLRYNIKTREEINRLWNFYQLCKGRYKAFNFQSHVPALLPYDQVTAWWPLHEGELTRLDDWNGFIYPTHSVRFQDDGLSYEEFSVRIQKTGIKLVQESPIAFTNNFGTLSGAATWVQCPDGSAGVNFDGASGQASMGDAAALDVGTGDFSFALCLYPNSLAATVYVLSKKTNSGAANKGYRMSVATNGQITVLYANGTLERTITSAVGAITSQAWKIVCVTIDRDGNGQIYVNNAASGSPVAIGTSVDSSNSNNFFLGRCETSGYGNFRARNCLFAKKVWTQAERDLIWSTWRGILQI